MVVASSWLKPSRSPKLTSRVFLSGRISSSPSRRYFTSPSPVWNLHSRKTSVRLPFYIIKNQNNGDQLVVDVSRPTTKLLLDTHSSRKAWNNFWHFSASSSFTIVPACSAVAVATSILLCSRTAQRSEEITRLWKEERSTRPRADVSRPNNRRRFRAKTEATWRLARHFRPIGNAARTQSHF